VPIRSGSQVTGLIEVFSPQPYAFNAKDISVLQELTLAILSARAADAPTHIPPPETQRTPVRPLPVAPTEVRRVEEQPAPGFLAETMNAGASSRSSLHKIILVLAAVTFVFAVVWLIAPVVTGHTSGSKRVAPNVHQPSAGAVSKPVTMPANVTDLSSLRRVAEQGDPAAQFALGARYATGEDVPQDYSQAVHWFSLAADQGHILAQATLGAYYWAGRGVPPDLTKAYFWSALAQAGGDQASKYRVAVLTSRMSRNDILTAQQQANDWLRNHQTAGNTPTSR
jgi:Sel1 repeat